MLHQVEEIQLFLSIILIVFKTRKIKSMINENAKDKQKDHNKSY